MTPSELMRAYYRALDVPDLSQLDALFIPDAEWRFPGSTLLGATAVKRALARSLSTGLRMEHKITHLLEQGDTAICELVATNTVYGRTFLVRGAVVCETQGGRIKRLAAYPDATEMNAFLVALQAGARWQRFPIENR